MDGINTAWIRREWPIQKPCDGEEDENGKLIHRLCDALDACRKERDAGFALRDLALKKACSGSRCLDLKCSARSNFDESCSVADCEQHFLRQATEEIGRRS